MKNCFMDWSQSSLLFLFLNKIFVIQAEIYKMHARIANKKDLNLTLIWVCADILGLFVAN